MSDPKRCTRCHPRDLTQSTPSRKEHPMTDRPDLDAIRQRADAATPGPWGVEQYGTTLAVHAYQVSDAVAMIGDEDHPPAGSDAEFIAHAREDVPALLAEVDRLTARVVDLEGERDAWLDDHADA